MKSVIDVCGDRDFPAIHTIINDAAEAYRGIIPADRWSEPYMSESKLRREIGDGVEFLGYYDEDGALTGVMGRQDMGDVFLIRHAYVLTRQRRCGIGARLITAIHQSQSKPHLVGTWAAATWAIDFYRKHGFRLVTHEEKERLLRLYWSIPERQVETSVVLGDAMWFETTG